MDIDECTICGCTVDEADNNLCATCEETGAEQNIAFEFEAAMETDWELEMKVFGPYYEWLEMLTDRDVHVPTPVYEFTDDIPF